MLEANERLLSLRKVRLFAISCCHQNKDSFDEPREFFALATAERLADGLISDSERTRVEASLYDLLNEREDESGGDWELGSPFPIHLLAPRFTSEDAKYLAEQFAEVASYSHKAFDGLRYELRLEQADFLRDIFGNPFRPVPFDPRWRTSDVVGLARAIYDDKVFERMPILADALMDAGCEEEQVISHCRGEGPHVRGCWVVDLILGKE